MNSFEFSKESGDVSRDLDLLRDMRERIIRDAYEKFDDATVREAEEEEAYLQFAPLDTPSDDILALLLTRDGERPFSGEEKEKEQVYLYFPSEHIDLIWIEHIKDGIHEKFTLTPEGLDTVAEDVEDFFLLEEEIEPTPEDFIDVVGPEHLASDLARLGTLRELINRLMLTKFS